MRSYADVLKRISKNLANLYVKQTGKSYDDIKKLMNDETYFFGKEILDNGFCDFIIEIEKNDTKTKDDAVEEARKVIKMANKKQKEEDLDIQTFKNIMIQCFNCDGSHTPVANTKNGKMATAPTIVETKKDKKELNMKKEEKADIEDKTIENANNKDSQSNEIDAKDIVNAERQRILDINSLVGSEEIKQKAIQNGDSVGDTAIALNKNEAKNEADTINAVKDDFADSVDVEAEEVVETTSNVKKDIARIDDIIKDL